jgi:hypothetical protein
MIFITVGTCLDFVSEAPRVSERIAALESSSGGVKTFWSDPRRRGAIVLLQDRAQHIEEAVDGCQKYLITMHSVMLPSCFLVILFLELFHSCLLFLGLLSAFIA